MSNYIIDKDGNYITDKDGYPTEFALKLIHSWYDEGKTADELVSFIKDIWCYPERFQLKGKKVKTLYLSTGGWSGNEAIISALSKTLFWDCYWQKSIRGGHYWFKYKEVR